MHDKFTMLMSQVLDGEATPDEDQALRAHVERCPECARTWELWRTCHNQFMDAPLLAAPPTLLPRITAAIQQPRPVEHRPWWLASGVLIIWGAIILSLIAGSSALVVWAVRHPLEAAILMSTGAQILSAVSWLLRSVSSFIRSFDLASLAVGLMAYVGTTLVLVWAWLKLIRRLPARSVAVEGGMS